MTTIDTLTATQKRAIAALLTERDVRSAARAAHISERTLWRWLDDGAFREELSRQEGAVMDEVTRGLLSLQSAALEELQGMMVDDAITPGVRLQAVKTALEMHLKYRELNNLEERVKRLEELNHAGN